MARAYSIEADSGEEPLDETRICLKCGYQLTGLGERGNCPECGTGFGKEWVIAGYKSRGGPGSTVGWGIGFLLLGAAELFGVVFDNASMLSWETVWGFMTNPCSIIGVITLAFGVRGIMTARRHGGDLRWVLTQGGIYSIRDNGSAGKPIPWSDVRKVYVPFIFGLRPRRWRLIKVRRRWGIRSGVLEKRTPELWLKDRTRRELISIVVDINLRFLEGNRSREPENPSIEDHSTEEANG